MVIGPLHPNKRYWFSFRLHPTPGDLRTEIASKKIKAARSEHLVDSLLSVLQDDAVKVSGLIEAVKTGPISTSSKSRLENSVFSLSSDQLMISSYWPTKEVVSSTGEGVFTYVIQVKDLLDRIDEPLYRAVVFGTKKLSPAGIISSDGDPDSLSLLALQALISTTSTVTKPEGVLIANLQSELESFKLFRAEIARKRRADSSLETSQKQSIETVEIQHRVDVTILDHIIADFGIGRTFTYRGSPKQNITFLYLGAEVYFVPVDKDGPLRQYFRTGGIDWLLKRIYVMAALAVAKLVAPDATARLVGTLGDVALGAGVRIFNRGWSLPVGAVRLNGGLLFYKQKHANPVVQGHAIKYAPYYGFSADLDIEGVAKLITSIFKIGG